MEEGVEKPGVERIRACEATPCHGLGRLVFLVPILAAGAVAAIDARGTMDANRIGVGAGPIAIAPLPGTDLLATANWGARSIGLHGIHSGKPPIELPAGYFPILVVPSRRPKELFFACNYRHTLGVVDLDGRSPSVRTLAIEGDSRDVPGPDPRDCFIVAVVPVPSSTSEVYLVRALLGSRTLNLFEKWWIERVRVEGARLVVLARSEARSRDFVSIGAWCARLDEATGDLWVSDPPGDLVLGIDGSLGSFREVPVPGFPRAMAIDPEGRRLFVASELGGEVSVIFLDGPPRVSTRRPAGHDPIDLEWDPERGLLVLLRGDRQLLVLDPATLEPAGRLGFSFPPWDAALTPGGGVHVVGEGADRPLEVVFAKSGSQGIDVTREGNGRLSRRTARLDIAPAGRESGDLP